MAGVTYDRPDAAEPIVIEPMTHLAAASRLQDCQVIFVLPHLGPGGAQRVATLVANHWAAQGVGVGLITTLDNKPDAHQLDPAVRRVRLGTGYMADEQRSGWAHRLTARIRYVLTGSQARSALRRLARRAGGTGAVFLFKLSELLAFPSRTDQTSYKRDTTLGLARFLVGPKERQLRKVLRASAPQCVISFLTKTNIHTALASWDLPAHVVVSERNDPDLQELDPIWDRLRAYSYRRAKFVTSNSEGVLDKLRRFCHEPQLQLLPNPLVIPSAALGGATRHPRFIIVARLVHQKAIDVLLTAFARIVDRLPDWTLEVVGDGPLLDELRQLACKLGISERVAFRGHVTNPLDYMLEASVFILPSRFEGMPNSLLEAMAAGLPPIVSDASPGPLELVEDGATGLVVPVDDAEALAQAMLRLAQDEAYRIKLGDAAKAYVGKHDWSEVEPLWREVLQLPVAAD